MERKRQKLVGRDQGSLTEQQTKGTATTMIQKKGNTQNKPHDPESRSPTPPPLCAPEPRVRVPTTQLPAPGTPHGGTWYGIPGSVWPGWGWVSPARLCPFLESGEN